MIFRQTWRVFAWCTRLGGRLSLWTVWLFLAALLVGQIHLLSSRRVPIPDPLRRVVEQRLAPLGLQLKFGRARMNLTGRFVLEDVRLGSTDIPAPLATARYVYLRLDPWDLLAGRFTLQDVRVSGLDLYLTAPHSPSGKDESPATNIDFALRPLGREIEVSHLTGYIRNVPVHVSGRLQIPAAASADTSPHEKTDNVVAAYLGVAERMIAADTWLAALESPRLKLRLNPTALTVDFYSDAIDLRAIPGSPDGKLAAVRAQARIPLNRHPRPSPVTITGTIASIDLPHDIAARDLSLRIQGMSGGPGGFTARSLDLQLASLNWRKIETGSLAASATRPAGDAISVDASFSLAGSPWRLTGNVEPRGGTGRLWLEGFVDDATLAFAGNQIDRDLSSLLDPVHPAPLQAAASFGPGWKLAEATGRLHSGPVRVGLAHLDETGTEFIYDGVHVLCDHLVLRQGESLAHGSYEMDTRTMDFRFLLTGGLRPAGIEGWFREWWSNFWSTFDFSRALPVADVDVRGRWGDLTATRVFVQAEGAGTGLKGIAFDRVRTRLFLRPHWFDILHFNVLQSGQEADGWLSRSLDLESDTWRHMEFAVDSALPLETISALFKAESATLLAPYRFTTPPSLKLSGRVDSPASPRGKHEHIDIGLSSSGAMTYHDFPLSELKFEANLRDDRIDLPMIAVNFAEGQANGKARVWKADDGQRLAFDIALANANLGAVTQAIALVQPSAAPATDKASEAARERQERIEKGRLAFNLAAEGRYEDFYSFKGTGRAAITGTELAQLNLFGPLSEVLRGPYISFGSFSLTIVDAPFELDGDRLRFENLRITGPSALLQAQGNYRLRDGRLDFGVKVHPFGESPSVVGSAVGFVLSPLSAALEVKLLGTLTTPSWIFAYGPSRLLNTITGGEKTPRPPAPVPPVIEPPVTTPARTLPTASEP